MYCSVASAVSVSPGPLARRKVMVDDNDRASAPCELAAAANQIGAEGPSVKSLHTLNTLVGTLITHIRTEDKRVARHVKGG